MKVLHKCDCIDVRHEALRKHSLEEIQRLQDIQFWRSSSCISSHEEVSLTRKREWAEISFQAIHLLVFSWGQNETKNRENKRGLGNAISMINRYQSVFLSQEH